VAAIVRVAMLIFVSLRVVLCWLGNGMVEWAEVWFADCVCKSHALCSGSGVSNAVDIFNVTSGAWSTAALSVARGHLAATSLPNLGVAIFAGGGSTCCHVDFRIVSRVVLCRVGEWDA